jgi:prolyl-tRNA synthetase
LENSKKVRERSEKIYETLLEMKTEVLYDDRENATVGEKFAEADLIGIPLRIVVSERTLKSRSIEVKRRDEEKSKLVKIHNLEGVFK